MICRVCRTDEGVREFGRIQPYVDFSCMVYHCEKCRSRFAARNESIYETLHSSSGSSYAYHRDFAIKAAEAYRAKNRERLRDLLATVPKNKFIMDILDRLPPESNLLEIGCSRGYLTSYSLLSGHHVLGTDVSESALEDATQHFGPNFCVAGSELIEQRAPFDVVYHVGTIGCVEAPIELTDNLLTLLSPGGTLAFNAPNVLAATWQELSWVRSSYPPDVVCLFHPSLWELRYGKSYDVEVTVEKVPLSKSLEDARHRGKEFAATGSLTGSETLVRDGSVSTGGALRGKAESLLRRAVRSLPPIASSYCRPADFGLHVVMRKRNSH